MTETSILPGATPASDADVNGVPPGIGDDENEGGGGDRRRLLILGGVIGLLVVLAAAYLLLHKGSSSDNSAPFVPTSTHTAPTAPAGGGTKSGGSTKGKTGGSQTKSGGSQPKSGKAPTTVPKKAHQPQVRDPFKALVTPPETGGTSSGTGTTVVGSSPTPTPNPSTSTPVTTQSTPPVSQTTPPASTNPKGVTGPPLSIQLMSVRGTSAKFRVFYSHHKFRTFQVTAPKGSSAQGTVFDKVFALLGVQDRTATIQIGDDTPFDLPEGVAHTV